MARRSKSGVNVSEAIREFLKANSSVGPTEAAKAISAKIGQKVSSTYVSNIKGLMKSASKKTGRKGRKAGRKAGPMTVAARSQANGSVELKTIVAVKALVAEVGADRIKQLIDLLA